MTTKCTHLTGTIELHTSGRISPGVDVISSFLGEMIGSSMVSLSEFDKRESVMISLFAYDMSFLPMSMNINFFQVTLFATQL